MRITTQPQRPGDGRNPRFAFIIGRRRRNRPVTGKSRNNGYLRLTKRYGIPATPTVTAEGPRADGSKQRSGPDIGYRHRCGSRFIDSELQEFGTDVATIWQWRWYNRRMGIDPPVVSAGFRGLKRRLVFLQIFTGQCFQETALFTHQLAMVTDFYMVHRHSTDFAAIFHEAQTPYLQLRL